jgi:HlyD family secretion protein
VFGLGTVEARVLSKIGFEVGAAITELNADHGDLVKQGQVLARLHAAQQEAKVARAKAAVLSAEVAVKKADANTVKARAILAQRLEVNKRKQQLVSRQVTSTQAGEEAQRDEDVAPYDALVVDRQKELGTVIKAGDTVFTLVATGSIWALAYIDESRSGAIREDQPAEVRLRSLPHQVFPARVVRVGIESDRVTEERRVYVKCEQCPVRFHLGEQAEVLITVATLPKARLVPEAAVTGYDGTKGKVWSIEDGRLKRRIVSFGHRTEGSRLEIRDELAEGIEVVTHVGEALREGRAARAIQEGKR